MRANSCGEAGNRDRQQRALNTTLKDRDFLLSTAHNLNIRKAWIKAEFLDITPSSSIPNELEVGSYSNIPSIRK